MLIRIARGSAGLGSEVHTFAGLPVKAKRRRDKRTTVDLKAASESETRGGKDAHPFACAKPRPEWTSKASPEVFGCASEEKRWGVRCTLQESVPLAMSRRRFAA